MEFEAIEMGVAWRIKAKICDSPFYSAREYDSKEDAEKEIERLKFLTFQEN
jgi:hypothetical protein